MKKLIAALGVAVVAGCTEGTGPLELPVGPNFHQAPVTSTFPVAFTALNACIGGNDDFFGTATQTVHFFEFGNPIRHHFNLHARLELESAAGFSGSAVQQVVDNGTPEGGAPDEEFSALVPAINVNMSNESGQRLIVNIVFHITIRNGVVVRSLVDRFRIRCVGKPNG